MNNKSIVIIGAVAVAGVTAVCGILHLATRRKRVKPTPVAVVKSVTPPKPIHQATASERETVKVVSVTKEPTEAFDAVYRMVEKLKQLKLPIANPVFEEALIYRRLVRDDVLTESQFHMELCMDPEAFAEPVADGKTQIIIDPVTGACLIIDGGDYYATYLNQNQVSDERFVISGPCFENVSTAGMLELILEKYMETWGL